MDDEATHTHDSDFVSESLVQARVCKNCGAYVSARLLQQHVDFHERSVVKGSEEQLTLFP